MRRLHDFKYDAMLTLELDVHSSGICEAAAGGVREVEIKNLMAIDT